MNEGNLERLRRVKELISTALEEERSWPARNDLGRIQNKITEAIERHENDSEV